MCSEKVVGGRKKNIKLLFLAFLLKERRETKQIQRKLGTRGELFSVWNQYRGGELSSPTPVVVF